MDCMIAKANAGVAGRQREGPFAALYCALLNRQAEVR
jgi:hypothetical protein